MRKKKNRRGEEVGRVGSEWSCLLVFPFPLLSLFIPFFSLSKGFLLAKRETCKWSQEN